MKKFEIGKTYGDGEGIEIKILKRTAKQITFIFTNQNWWEQDTEKEHKRKIKTYSNEHETIELGAHWSAPNITA